MNFSTTMRSKINVRSASELEPKLISTSRIKVNDFIINNEFQKREIWDVVKIDGTEIHAELSTAKEIAARLIYKISRGESIADVLPPITLGIVNDGEIPTLIGGFWRVAGYLIAENLVHDYENSMYKSAISDIGIDISKIAKYQFNGLKANIMQAVDLTLLVCRENGYVQHGDRFTAEEQRNLLEQVLIENPVLGTLSNIDTAYVLTGGVAAREIIADIRKCFDFQSRRTNISMDTSSTFLPLLCRENNETQHGIRFTTKEHRRIMKQILIENPFLAQFSNDVIARILTSESTKGDIVGDIREALVKQGIIPNIKTYTAFNAPIQCIKRAGAKQLERLMELKPLMQAEFEKGNDTPTRKMSEYQAQFKLAFDECIDNEIDTPFLSKVEIQDVIEFAESVGFMTLLERDGDITKTELNATEITHKE